MVDTLVGIIDPLRPDVPAAVALAQAAGVKVRCSPPHPCPVLSHHATVAMPIRNIASRQVRMVTGDNLKTATAIADKAGILKPGDVVMEGPEFRKLTPAQLDALVRTAKGPTPLAARSSAAQLCCVPVPPGSCPGCRSSLAPRRRTSTCWWCG